jgi:hypothetical protein
LLELIVRLGASRIVTPLVAGVLIGALLAAPGTGTAVTTYTRYASCPGVAFYPAFDEDYATFAGGSMRYPLQGTPVTFRCDPHLPNGAIVKSLKATVIASSSDPDTKVWCAMTWSGLSGSTSTGDYGAMAGGPGLATVTGSGSAQVLTDSSINSATIDNTTRAYWIECTTQVDAADSPFQVGIFAAVVKYTITAAKG